MRLERSTIFGNAMIPLAFSDRLPAQTQSSHKRFKLPDRIDLKRGCADCSNDTGFDTCLNPYSRYQTYYVTLWNR